MADDIPAKKRRRRAKLSPAELREKLARLALCTRKLTPEEVALLDEVFPEIIALHKKVVHDVLRNLPPLDVEDLSQITFVKVHARLCAEGFIEELDHLFVRIARTLRYDHLRARRRSPMEHGLPSSGAEKPRSLGSDQRAANLLAAYHRVREALAPPYLEILHLVFEEQLSRREAARILKIPEGTVKKRIVYVRNALRVALGEVVPEAEAGEEGEEGEE
ncbi:MAG: sigma-70 family RNA polymerase sigma factor [Minicystis sp.]